MANDYFKFKRFTIKQDKSAMKVCTDSCIFGASITYENPNRILDIGTGTGLLALMLAQRLTAKIDAVELEKAAALQAKENVEASPWAKDINVSNCSIQEFVSTASHRYDLIVCNPPFFNKHLVSKEKNRNLAIHNDNTLSNIDLLRCVKKLISPIGHFFVMLPPHEAKVFENLAIDFNLFVANVIEVYDNENSKVLRLILKFQNKKTTKNLTCLNIKKNKVEYSEAFAHLLEPYYLNL